MWRWCTKRQDELRQLAWLRGQSHWWWVPLFLGPITQKSTLGVRWTFGKYWILATKITKFQRQGSLNLVPTSSYCANRSYNNSSNVRAQHKHTIRSPPLSCVLAPSLCIWQPSPTWNNWTSQTRIWGPKDVVDLLIVIVTIIHWLQDSSLPSALLSTSKVDWVYCIRGDNIAFDNSVELKMRDRPNLACKDLSRE